MKTIIKTTIAIVALATIILSCSKSDDTPAPVPVITPAKDLVTVTTLAGTTTGNSTGQGAAVKFASPSGITMAPSGNIFVADYANNNIRLVTPSGLVSAHAENTAAEIAANNQKFTQPFSIFANSDGSIFTADSGSHRIKVSGPDGSNCLTYAGSTIGNVFSLIATSGKLNEPTGFVANANGSIYYIADRRNNHIKKYDAVNGLTLFAGNALGTANNAGGTGGAAGFNQPIGIALDTDGNVYVTDWGNNNIRKITPAGLTSVLAGTGSAGDAVGPGNVSSFRNPIGIAVDANKNVYVVDSGNHKIKKITAAGVVSVVAGTTAGDLNGSEKVAQFKTPSGITIDAVGNLYVTDLGNHKVKKITFN
jgi:sugar lactone lactonase YvrE